MSVDRLDTFVLIALEYDLEVLEIGGHHLVETNRTLAHSMGLGRAQDQMRIDVPNLLL